MLRYEIGFYQKNFSARIDWQYAVVNYGKMKIKKLEKNFSAKVIICYKNTG